MKQARQPISGSQKQPHAAASAIAAGVPACRMPAARPRRWLGDERVADAPFAADADRGEHARREQRPVTVGEAGRDGADRVDQDAPHHRRAAADPIGDPAQPEAAERGREHHPAVDPGDVEVLVEAEVLRDDPVQQAEQEEVEEVEHPAEPAEREHAAAAAAEQVVAQGHERAGRGFR